MFGVNTIFHLNFCIKMIKGNSKDIQINAIILKFIFIKISRKKNVSSHKNIKHLFSTMIIIRNID